MKTQTTTLLHTTALVLASVSFAETPTSEQLDFFETRIRPVLADKCYSCHSAEAGKSKGDLWLDTRENIRKGGETGSAVVPGDLEKSLLIQAIRYADEDTAMPPKNKGGRLPDSVIADFEKWVRFGAPDPREGAAVKSSLYDPEAAKSWWAYQPVLNPTIPEPKRREWAHNDIDKFILSSLEAAGLTPVPDADANSLLRRVYLDLAGLPPPPEAVKKFNADPDIEAVVDSLLATRQFAERWGRHWLDMARYAESTGRDVNVTMPEA